MITSFIHTGISTYVMYLYAGSCVFSAQAAGQSPAASGDVGHLGNGLHLLRTAYTHLEGTHNKETHVYTNVYTNQSTLGGDSSNFF